MPPKRYFEQAEAEAEEAAAATATSSSTQQNNNNTTLLSSSLPSQAGATLFISRLPYTATSTDLQTLFSEIGPLKRAFVVTDPQSKLSKGVGYVTFSILDDAKNALQQLQGKSLDGGKRKIQITFADEKAPLKERKLQLANPDVGPSAPKRAKIQPTPNSSFTKVKSASTSFVAKDTDAVRTVVLSGLAAITSQLDSKQIYKRARKIGDVENVIYPFPSTSKSNDVAHVIFRTPNHAMLAVEKLHAHIFKGVQISAILKKRADNAARIVAHMRPETLAKREEKREEVERISGKGTMPVLMSEIDKMSRLIIRNLPFDVTETDLRAIFLPFGPIFNINIPTTLKKGKSNKGQGATVKANPASTDSVVSDVDEDEEDEDDEDDVEEKEKDGDIKIKEDASKEDETSSTSEKEEDDDDEEIKPKTPESSTVERGRGFAFVWYVSKSDAARALQAVNGKTIRHGAAEHAAYKVAKGSRGRRAVKVVLDAVRAVAQPERIVAVDWAISKKDWLARADQSDVETDVEKDDDDDEKDSDDEDEDDQEEKAKPQLPAPEEGTTLFIRNLPYQATEDELRTLFRQFGPLRYAKITMDKATQRSKGTGFVCFWQKASADVALQRSRLIEQETSSGGAGAASAAQPTSASKNPFTMPSVLTADPSAPLAASFHLHGRVLNVIPAVDRNQATQLETFGRKLREKEDKRNTWLLREGVPLNNSELPKTMSQAETDKRLQSFSVRKAQLAGNPSLYISKTRLAIRSLPLFVTDKIIKKLALHSIRTFHQEIKSGQRVDLDDDEKADKTISSSGDNRSLKKGIRPTSVVQAKVVRQKDRIDSLTGSGKSRGYGFLEMRSYQDSLKVVRWANGNKNVSKLFLQWWQEDLTTSIERMKKQIKAKTKPVQPSNDSNSNKKATTDSNEAKDEIEEMQARKKRMERKLEELKNGESLDKSERGGLVMIEFAIENAVTTKKRAQTLAAWKESAAKRKQREEGGGEDEGRDEKREEKSEGRRNRSDRPERSSRFNKKNSVSLAEEKLLKKQADQVETLKNNTAKHGFMIGKKRRVKKAGKSN